MFTASNVFELSFWYRSGYRVRKWWDGQNIGIRNQKIVIRGSEVHCYQEQIVEGTSMPPQAGINPARIASK